MHILWFCVVIPPYFINVRPGSSNQHYIMRWTIRLDLLRLRRTCVAYAAIFSSYMRSKGQLVSLDNQYFVWRAVLPE
jgi:hypothetical protein